MSFCIQFLHLIFLNVDESKLADFRPNYIWHTVKTIVFFFYIISMQIKWISLRWLLHLSITTTVINCRSQIHKPFSYQLFKKLNHFASDNIFMVFGFFDIVDIKYVVVIWHRCLQQEPKFLDNSCRLEPWSFSTFALGSFPPQGSHHFAFKGQNLFWNRSQVLGF